MEDRITSRVIDHVGNTLDRRLCDFREELDDDLEEEIDNRLEVVKEGLMEYVVEETRGQIAEEFATLEEEFVAKVMDKIRKGEELQYSLPELGH
ncbi:hypothetical protein N0V93_010286 [Gnomoniopsis smithogilvyi]|uniref:Uncharacterized protein n=1 Tax=Gnomoniopsis smithogilvyi TaxID=1191159 RepID=A0A9W8YIB9_9PEZI|nr:hypothetical protein N0V93_010286 [Gnomoniopsis smithogilvyi]